MNTDLDEYEEMHMQKALTDTEKERERVSDSQLYQAQCLLQTDRRN